MTIDTARADADSMDLADDLRGFVTRHRAHGRLTGDATEPSERGYLVTVACSCGVSFMRWITPQDAVRELVNTTLIATSN